MPEPFQVADAGFWREEVARSRAVAEPYFPKWEENRDYYEGKPLTSEPTQDYVNVNVDFYQTEQKCAQLFFRTPELQLAPGQGFDPLLPGIVASRAVLNALLGMDCIDSLQTTLKAIKDCVATAGTGATVIGYQPTIVETPMEPQPGAILGLNQPVPVPIHEDWFWTRVPSKKFRVPADFHDTDWEKSPWLAYDFRMPLKAARQAMNLPPDFTGTTTRDLKVLGAESRADQATSMAYVDGTMIWYKASLFDDDVQHPLVYRRHVLIDGIEGFADQDDLAWKSPYQTLAPDGRLTADSMIGNPIHPLNLRDLPDSAYVPSDNQMTRPLVKELCLFRTQMVQSRDVNKPKFAYNVDVIPPDAVSKIEAAVQTGSLIPLPGAAFAGGLDMNFRLLAQGTNPRETYTANDYIERDIAKTHRLGSNQVGVTEATTKSATETAEVSRSLQVSLDAERNQAMRWHLRGVDKVFALALRFLTDPRRVTELIGPQLAPVWLQYRDFLLQNGDPRPKFTAKPDSQVNLDAAGERKYWLDLYNHMRKDPAVNPQPLLAKIWTLAGEDPMKFAAPPQEETPDPSLGFSFKGEDLNPLMPQFPIVLAAMAQAGITIPPQAIAEAQKGAMNQLLMGPMATESEGTPASSKPAAHGGTVDKADTLSKHTADRTGERSGPKVQ